MPHHPLSNEILYVGLLYLGLRRFTMNIAPLLGEQTADESPANMYAKTSYTILNKEYAVLKDVMRIKHLTEYDLNPQVVALCEATRGTLVDAVEPFLEVLLANAKEYSWMEAIAGGEDTTIFFDKYNEHLSRIENAFIVIIDTRRKLEQNYPGMDGIKWNYRWRE